MVNRDYLKNPPNDSLNNTLPAFPSKAHKLWGKRYSSLLHLRLFQHKSEIQWYYSFDPEFAQSFQAAKTRLLSKFCLELRGECCYQSHGTIRTHCVTTMESFPALPLFPGSITPSLVCLVIVSALWSEEWPPEEPHADCAITNRNNVRYLTTE